MRLKKPTRAIIDQVRITREGNDAIIDYADAGIAGAGALCRATECAAAPTDLRSAHNYKAGVRTRLMASGWPDER